MKHKTFTATTGRTKLVHVDDNEAVVRRPNGQTIKFLISPSQRPDVEAILRNYF